MKKAFEPVRITILRLTEDDVLRTSSGGGIGGTQFLPTNPGDWDTNSKKG